MADATAAPEAFAAAEAAGATGASAAGRQAALGAPVPARRFGTGRAVAMLALVATAALVPLLGPSAALHGTGEAAAPGVGGIGLVRGVLFAALCVLVGEVFTERLARRVPGAPVQVSPRSAAAPAAVAGFLAALGLAAIVSTGNLLPHRFSDLDIGGLYRTRDGALALIEVNAFLLAALCARARSTAVRVVPLAAVVLAEALRAHPVGESTPLVGSALTAVHLTCAALWTGGLWQVLRVLRRWRGLSAPGTAARTGEGARAALLGLYARVAAVLLAVLAATGVCSALRRMPLDTVLDQLVTTAYGRTLLAKVLLMAVVAVLALSARLRLSRTADPLTACTPARAEVAALGVVVAVSALLTALPLPIRW